MRVGFGYDVHRLVRGRKLILGGVEIPFEKGLLGHSDADVLCHAVGDALLGAAGMGDLGHHFPVDDVRYEDISSLLLLREIEQMIVKANFAIINIDATLVVEKPRISHFVEQMEKNIATSLQLSHEQVSVKVTTSEGLGFTGTGDGIAAYAVGLIEEK